jgi:hypothetical protein
MLDEIIKMNKDVKTLLHEIGDFKEEKDVFKIALELT